MKALINWALISSEQIRGIISDNYKGARREDDLNVAISVQPWGRDGDRRRYWLIEGKGASHSPQPSACYNPLTSQTQTTHPSGFTANQILSTRTRG